MCGIVGIFERGGRRVDPRILLAMTRTLVHRGPDEEGYFVNARNAGRFTRLGGLGGKKVGKLGSQEAGKVIADRKRASKPEEDSLTKSLPAVTLAEPLPNCIFIMLSNPVILRDKIVRTHCSLRRYDSVEWIASPRLLCCSSDHIGK